MRNTGPSRTIRAVVVARSVRNGSPRCERCGATPPEQIHHRKPRGLGGTSDSTINGPANLVAICRACHVAIESRREKSYRDGWLVHRPDDPANTPVHYRGQPSYLTPNGTVTTVEETRHVIGGAS